MSPRILEAAQSNRNKDLVQGSGSHKLTEREKYSPTTVPDATVAEFDNFDGAAKVSIKRDVINHKVEQIVRALYLGLESQNVDCTQGTALENFKADDWLIIGVADHRGYRFTPSTNTRLIMMGLNPSSVLASLTRMRFNGSPVVAAQGSTLIAMHGAVAQNARDQLFNTKQLLELHRCTGKPKLFA